MIQSGALCAALVAWVSLAQIGSAWSIVASDGEVWDSRFFGGSGTYEKRQEKPVAPVNIGPRASIGPTKSEIINATWTYSPGRPPPSINGDIFLWSGLYDDEHRNETDALQVVIEGHPQRRMKRICEANSGQWCLRPYVKHGCCLYQSPPAVSVQPYSYYSITMHKNDGPGGLWHQSIKDLSKQNKELFSYIKGNAPATWFGVAAEMRGGVGGTADLQRYSEIRITLRDPDPDFGKTLFMTKSVVVSPPKTTDFGKTWFIRYILIPSMVRE